MINFFKKILPGLICIAISLPVIAQNSIATRNISSINILQHISNSELPVAEASQKQVFKLNSVFLNQQLTKVQTKQGLKQAVIGIPMPDGREENFILEESNTMHPLLAAKYPRIKTFKGKSIKNPAVTAFIDQTPNGFHAMILDKEGLVYVNPINISNQEYVSFYKKDLKERTETMTCGIDKGKEFDYESLIGRLRTNNQVSSGTNLRIYRLALAATAEYTAARGGTVESALASMVTTMNRVNGIYENELSIRMELIPETDKLIYTNATTDPYTNNDGYTMLDQNQANINTVIGTNNYDIGHVFSTGGGGIAQLKSPCNNSLKAMGVTGSPYPKGDAFDVDYVAHEMGHQFGANHTFNSNQGSCQGNKNQGTAFEPGSGSTIMAYAGICSSDNIQNNSDAFFHSISLDEILSFTNTGAGRTCPVVSTIQNTVPTVNAAGTYYIPFKTPFQLTGSASDVENDDLTYCWEEVDAGPSGSPKTPSGNAPSFRSLPPSTSPTRIFPKFRGNLIGEVLPTYARTMNFRLTVRDNHPGGGAIAHNTTPVKVNVINTVDPFKVIYYVDSTRTWQGGSKDTITWNVASTDKAPINCTHVNILLSTDGGFNYPTVIASNVPNTGAAEIKMPNVATAAGRIKIEAVGNVFFNYSPVNFTVIKTEEPDTSQSTVSIDLPKTASANVFPNPFKENLSISFDSNLPWTKLSIINSLGSVVKNYDLGKPASTPFQINMADQSSGVYLLLFSGATGNKSYKVIKQ